MDAIQRRMELMSLSPDYVGSGLVGGARRGRGSRGGNYVDGIIGDIQYKQNKILKDIKSLNKDKKLLENYDKDIYGAALAGGRQTARGGCDMAGGSKNDAWQVHIRRTLRANPKLASDRPKLLKVASKTYKKKKK